MNQEKIVELKELVDAAAWEEGRECPHCDGSGQVGSGTLMVHAFVGQFGANHDLGSVHELIERADAVRWASDPAGHDLHVTVAGRVYRFDVPRPRGVRT